MPEVVSLNQADQFVGAHTAYACGFFAVMMCTSIAPLGHAPTKSAAQISSDALGAYARYNGDASANNRAGMSLPQLYSLLHDVGLHYQGTVLNLEHIRAWLRSGFPVIVAVAETSVHDLDLGGRRLLLFSSPLGTLKKGVDAVSWLRQPPLDSSIDSNHSFKRGFQRGFSSSRLPLFALMGVYVCKHS